MTELRDLTRAYDLACSYAVAEGTSSSATRALEQRVRAEVEAEADAKTAVEKWDGADMGNDVMLSLKYQ